jgi:hypothetical protein
VVEVTYVVSVWREPEGSWSASADEVDGAFTAGDSLAEIDRNIRESIAVSLDLPRGAEATMGIDLRVRIDADTDAIISDVVTTRRAAARSPEVTAAAVRTLRSQGLSVRDVARVLGITSGRVTQLDSKVCA